MKTLGSEIRGARLGYRYMPSVAAYVRVAPCDDGFCVDVAPAGSIPSHGAGVLHYAWWEGPPDLIADLSAAVVQAVAGPTARSCRMKRGAAFVTDKDFRPIQWRQPR